jgi:hypothetical protein
VRDSQRVTVYQSRTDSVGTQVSIAFHVLLSLHNDCIFITSTNITLCTRIPAAIYGAPVWSCEEKTSVLRINNKLDGDIPGGVYAPGGTEKGSLQLAYPTTTL